MDSDSVKDKTKTRPSKETEDKKYNPPEEPEPMYQFQGQYARSQHWFELDPDWIEDTFMTRDPDFFKRLHLECITG